MPVQNIGPNAIQAAKFRIKFRDIFNLKEFYRVVHDWLVEYNWSSVDSDGRLESGKDQFETLYLERIGSQGEKEMWWWWRVQKIPTDNSYYKYHMDLDYHILYMYPAEVMRDGKKFKANKGEVEITFWGYLQFDYTGEWSKHPILKLFNRVFPRRIFHRELYEDHKMELYREMYVLQAYIKRWFKIKSFLPYEEITHFHTPEVYPEWKKE